MSEQITDLKVASPVEIVEAWQGGVMYHQDARNLARNLVNAHPPPPGMSDPTFHTPEDGKIVWHRARDISNIRAMQALKEYLFKRGLALPAEVGLAWGQILERQQWAQNVREAVEELLRENIEEEDLNGTVDLMDRIAKGLAARVE